MGRLAASVLLLLALLVACGSGCSKNPPAPASSAAMHFYAVTECSSVDYPEAAFDGVIDALDGTAWNPAAEKLVCKPAEEFLKSQLDIGPQVELMPFGLASMFWALVVALFLSQVGAVIPARRAALNDPIASLNTRN